MSFIDNDAKSQVALSCYLNDPKITLFKEVFGNHMTHFNGFQKNIKYDDSDEIRYVIANENGYVFRNIVVEFELMDNNKMDKIDVYLDNNEYKINLLSICIEDLLCLMKYNIPQVYDNIMSIHSKSGKMILPIGNLIFNNKIITINTLHKFEIIHTSKCNIHKPSLKYEYYQITELESRRLNVVSIYVNGYNIEKYKLNEEGKCNINFKNCKLPIINIMIKSNDSCIESVQLQSNNVVHHVHDANELSTYNNFLNSTAFDPENEKMLYFVNFDTFGTFGYPSGKFFGTEEKNLIIYGKKDAEITVIMRFFTELQISKDVLNIMNLWKLFPNCDNYDPLTIVGENKYIEGYWFEEDSYKGKHYPFPKSTDIKVNDGFLQKLKNIMDKCKCNQCDGLGFDESGSDCEHCQESNYKYTKYLGFSSCRICNEHNGIAEYTIIDNGIEFTFPSGILHYYEDHNVQPSTKFYDFVMKLKI